ncbi:DUF4783 domain-containing protein [Oscillospiraceae bacterium N12]|jgi:hypothetical protein|uniref:DUF4783 domain-containing protein n=1 Tax=Jilunia laotingensis TaxID=2763675 RepID=A0A926IKH1_9BACT|nr:DUF4783 domain-containing protein [Jilunia laotingensis]MBC8593907.1 DUF4783 domain-containing protein [Jilunia laotingensis]
MKKRVLLWFAGLLFSVSTLFAQDVPVGVVVAFKKGSSQELNKYLGDKVDLVIQNRTASADKQEAESAMSTFFADNKVSSFNVNHQGKRDESSFVIGTLTTANGNFRVNCFFKRVQNKYLIHQIRIDKTNE